MAQTQLNRVYVQSIDGTGVTVNTLSIGTKALTGGITIGGAGTAANTITVDGGGVRINSSTTLDGTTTIPNLNAASVIVSGNTSLQNTSTLHLGVRGNASIVNASINTLQVLGETTLTNTSITNLGVTSQITLQNTSINGTLNVAGLTTMVNVSTTNLTVINNVSIGGNVSIIGHLRSLKLDTGNASINGILSVAGQTVLQNTSVNTTLNVDGRTTLRLLDVNALAVLNAGLNVSGAVSVDGNFTSSSLTINSGTVLNNVSLTTLTVSGNSSLNAVDIQGAVNINTGGTATTTIGSGTSRTVIANVSTSDVTVTGTLWATANTSLNNVSAQALTVGTLWAGATTATTLGATGLATLSGGLSVTSGATTLSGGLTSTAGSTTLGATTATTLGVTGLATLSGGLSVTAGATTLTGGLTSTAGSTTLGATTATTLSATSLATLSGGVTATGAININATGAGLTTIGTSSRTVIGNMSTSDTTVTGSLWVTGATAINKSGAGITEIGSTEVGSRTVIGNTSMIGGVDINTSGIGITMIGSTEFGARTILGNTSMNGSIDINTSGTGITTMGSETSSTVVKGDMSVTKLLTTGYTPALYNYAPTFFAAGFSGGNVSISNGPDYGFTLTAAKANVSSISPVSFLANKKYIVNFNARADSGTPEVTILGAPAFTPAATNTLYRQVITPTANRSTLALDISGAIGNKVSWNLLTIEPFYDMTLGSNQISLGGEINVSAGNPFTDWDPTRMLFTTSTISIGTNPRIAVGNNNALNASIFLATCDSAVNTSFFTSTDGVTWEQSSYSNASMSRGIAYHEANSSFVMITGGTPAKVWSSSTGNSGWSVLTTTPATMPISSVTNMVYGNSNLVAFNASTANNIIFSSEGKSWTLVTTEVPISITDMVYGKYSGAHVFVACGTNAFYRNQAPSNFVHQAVHWLAATGTKPAGTWAFVGFGNDIFMAASNDATGKVSRSVDGGVNWLTPILLNEILTSRPIYLENTWFIGSNTGLYVSKDDGLTWTKRVGNSLTRSVYGGKFVDVGTSLSLITKRNQRTDGSSISPDVITIGHEGATTVIGGTTTNIGGTGSTTSIAGNITLGSGSSVTIDDTLKVATIAGYGVDTIIRIGSTLTTGSIQMGNSQTTGTISLGSSASATNIPGRLNVTGLATLSGNVTMSGDINMNGFTNMNNTLQFTAPNGAGQVTPILNFTNTGYGGTEIRGVIGNGGAASEHSRLRFVSGGREALTINNITGRVGIFNMLNPQADLDVNGSLRYVSISQNSDRRIKKNIVDIDDMSALTILRKLKPKTYEYIDPEKRTDKVVFGFIAQEVKEELDYAVSQIKDPVPNIFSEATVTNDLITFTTYHTSNLLRDASNNLLKLVIKTKTIYEYANIVEVLDEYTLRIDRDLLYLCENGTLFVYGQEVNDFHTLNKEVIWTVATAALQEVDRQLQAEKQKTAAMQTDYDAKLSNLEARLLALEQKNV